MKRLRLGYTTFGQYHKEQQANSDVKRVAALSSPRRVTPAGKEGFGRAGIANLIVFL